MKISIITACYNSAQFIETCIQSVLSQGYENFEHIIIDGGSTDGTLEILRLYPHLKVISGADQGLYDAWNKGISLSQGDIIGIMNSDDFYGEKVFHKVSQLFRQDRATQIVTGRALQCSKKEGGKWLRVYDYQEKTSPCLELKNLQIWGPMINARFFKKHIFKEIGPFNINFKTAADIEFMIKIALRKYKISYIDDCICYYVSHPDSLTMSLNHTRLFGLYIEKLECVKQFLKDLKLSTQDKNIIQNAYTDKCAADFIYFLSKNQYENAKYFYKKGRMYLLKFIRSLIKEVLRILLYKIKKPFNKNNEIIFIHNHTKNNY